MRCVKSFLKKHQNAVSKGSLCQRVQIGLGKSEEEPGKGKGDPHTAQYLQLVQHARANGYTTAHIKAAGKIQAARKAVEAAKRR